MSMVKTRRAAVVEQVQELGVVAVIRMKDPAKLRAVVDALADGGVRAHRGDDDGAGRGRADRAARADAARRDSCSAPAR